MGGVNEEHNFCMVRKNKQCFYPSLSASLYLCVDIPTVLNKLLSLKTDSGNYTIWNKDQDPDTTGKLDQQLYGTHPMWLLKGYSNQYSIGFIRNR